MIERVIALVAGRRVGYLLACATAAVLLALGGARVSVADDTTPTATPTPLPEVTGTPIPPAPTAVPTRTPVPVHVLPVPVAPSPTAVVRRESRGHVRLAPRSPGATATPTRLAPRRARPHHHRARRHKRKHGARPRPSPTPTSTPLLNLTADDSISPVTCNGSGKPPARSPFLVPPYHGWTAIVSYFDHDSPNFLHDGTIVLASGMQASADGTHQDPSFPAYWSPASRQFVFYDGHNGYDYNLWYQPVFAAAAGKVIFAAFEYPNLPGSGYGRMVMIQHRDGYVTLYGHLSKIRVKPGQHVKAGQEIAISGNTGHSTGPHLHFTVFHNCTPVDPYGWSGQGPDPLASYRGETSLYAWLRPPLVLNPPRDWPGIDALPSLGASVVILLRLPSPAGGTAAFTAAVRREAAAVTRALGLPAGSARTDLLQGALDVRAPMDVGAIYRLPPVASVATSDTLEGQRADVLSVLSRAALLTPHRSVHLGRSPSWTGFLMTWQGLTLLVGRGVKGQQVEIRLGRGRGGGVVRRVKADPSNGAYVVDLGRLTRGQALALQRRLAASTTHTVSIERPPHAATSRTVGATSSSPGAAPWIASILVILSLLVVASAVHRRRARSSPSGE